MKSTMFWPPVWIAGLSSATSAAAAAARPTASTTQLTSVSPRSSRRIARPPRGAGRRLRRAWWSLLSCVRRSGRGSEGSRRRAGARARAAARPARAWPGRRGRRHVRGSGLLGTRLRRLLAQARRGLSLAASSRRSVRRPARRPPRDADECLALAERALAAGERERAVSSWPSAPGSRGPRARAPAAATGRRRARAPAPRSPPAGRGRSPAAASPPIAA